VAGKPAFDKSTAGRCWFGRRESNHGLHRLRGFRHKKDNTKIKTDVVGREFLTLIPPSRSRFGGVGKEKNEESAKKRLLSRKWWFLKQNFGLITFVFRAKIRL
jgi:hypothetical protein